MSSPAPPTKRGFSVDGNRVRFGEWAAESPSAAAISNVLYGIGCAPVSRRMFDDLVDVAIDLLGVESKHKLNAPGFKILDVTLVRRLGDVETAFERAETAPNAAERERIFDEDVVPAARELVRVSDLVASRY